MSNWFTRIFTHTHPIADGLTQAQREALLDLFNFCMCADGKIVVTEDSFISDQIARFHWEAPESVSAFSIRSIERARSAHTSEEGRSTYAADINNRLASTELKFEAIALAKRLFVIDGDYATSERETFSRISRAFSWPA